ncbi:hypothetical protein ACFL05_00910, partial [Patescibacteria group bacterium]
IAKNRTKNDKADAKILADYYTYDNIVNTEIVLKENNEYFSNAITDDGKRVLEFLLKNNVVVEDSEGINKFLENFPGIINCLYDIPERLKQYFPGSFIKLELFSDPEEDNSEELFAEVQTFLDPENASEQLSKLNREWLLLQDSKDLINFNFSLNFI